MTMRVPGKLDYHPISIAPPSGVVMVLAGSKYPRPAYYALGAWHYWHSDDECNPTYWCALPGTPPSDYMPLDVPLDITGAMVQGAFRFRLDTDLVDEELTDEEEGGPIPEWGAAVDTGITVDANTAFRLRVMIQEKAGMTWELDPVALYYKVDDGDYGLVTSTALESVRFSTAASTGDDNDPVTVAHLSGTGDFREGIYKETNGSVPPIRLGPYENTEIEWGSL